MSSGVRADNATNSLSGGTVTLADFIDRNLDALIDDWVVYARDLGPEESHLTETQLRNSARDLLTSIAADMRAPQTSSQQAAKSVGRRPDPYSKFNVVAHLHADDRLGHGFGINSLVAEYRALRASVLRRWQSSEQVDSGAFQEMIRFNEAIDQMVAESVWRYAGQTERIRDLFAGVVAHDMRSPVSAFLTATQILLRDKDLSPPSKKASMQAHLSAMRLKLLINDLFTFTHTRLGDSLPVELSPQNAGQICDAAVAEVRAVFPDLDIELRRDGDLDGRWDAGRLAQLVVNLLTNAARYGSGKIIVTAFDDGPDVTIAVENLGEPIPENAIPAIFDPLTRAAPWQERERTAASGMGLGLYICRCVVKAHGGTIEVDSNADRTTFTARLPRSLASRS
jgi:signal transduction histidine kinase